MVLNLLMGLIKINIHGVKKYIHDVKKFQPLVHVYPDPCERRSWLQPSWLNKLPCVPTVCRKVQVLDTTNKTLYIPGALNEPAG